MLELYLLEQLLAFANHGTLSAAAEALHISQPALSQSMKKLENQWGVPLFDRQKNRIWLNETGRMAASCAARLLEQAQDMEEQVRAFERSRRTISLGACAPVPVDDLTPLLTRLYEGVTISSEIRARDEELLEGLHKGRYQLVALHEPVEDPGLYVQPFRKEQLFLSLPFSHPLAERDALTLREIDGQNLLLYTKIGFWYELCCEKLPNAHFLMMSEQTVFNEVAGTVAFPSFVSDVVPVSESMRAQKKIVPILDEEVHVTYLCACRIQDRKRFAPLFRALGTVR